MLARFFVPPGRRPAASSAARVAVSAVPARPAAGSTALLALLVVGLLGACAPAAVRSDTSNAASTATNTASSTPPRTTAAVANAAGQADSRPVGRPAVTQESGMASWYGPGFAGRLTANGEVFDPSQLTAAHKELPFNTLVRVHNLENGASVVVRINDRGPFKPGRIIDLSRAGAEAIGMIGSGVARVQLELLTLPAGVFRVGTSGELNGYEVMTRLHPIGSLLVLSSPVGGEPTVVRVVSQDMPVEEPADLLVGYELYALVGAEVRVHED